MTRNQPFIVFISALLITGFFGAYAQDPKPSEELPAEDGGIESIIPQTESDEVLMEDVAPESIPAPEGSTPARGLGDAPEIYIVQTGDTLWDICEKFLGNPWYWPKLWSLNKYIKNPHLIYPGNELRFFGGSETAPPSLDIADTAAGAKEAPVEAPAIEEPAEVAPAPVVEGGPVPEDVEEEFVVTLRSLSYISEKELKAAGRITHSGEPKEHLVSGDRVYLEFGSKVDATKGRLFHVFERVKKVADPKRTFGKVGVMIRRKAVVKIIGVYKETIEGIITDAEDSVSRNDRLIPYQDPARKLSPHTTEKRIKGLIVESEKESYLISNNDFIFLNLGQKDGLDDGLEMVVVRRGDGVFQGDDKHLPDVIVGRLLVVETRDTTSTAYVTDLRVSLSIGDRVVSTLN